MSNNQNTKQDGRNLRRNRSDGRLKTYKSSDDCRAWNLNKRERQDYISGYIASSYEKFQGDASEWGRFVPVPVLVDVVVQSYKDELHKLHSKLQKVQQELLDCKEGKNFSTGKRHIKSEDIDIQVEEAIEEPALFIREETGHEVQTGNIYRREQSQEDKNEGEYSKGNKHAIMEEEYEREKERQQQLKNVSLKKNLINGTDSDSRTQNIRETLAEINTDFDKLMYLKDKEIKSLISMQDSIPQRVSNEEWDTSFQNEYPDFYENLKHYENDVEEKEREVKDLLHSIESQVMEEENMRNSRMGKDDESRTNDFSNRDHENMLESSMFDGKNSQNDEFAKLKGELDILSVRLSALESSGERGDVDKYDRQKEKEHLNEIQDLQDNLMVCKKALKNERLEKEEVENQLEKCIEEMFRSKNMADEKDRELSNLKDKLIRCKEEKEKLELKLDSLSTSERRSSKQVELSEELISELESQHTKEVRSFNEKISQMKKQLREREEAIDELQDKYQKLLEQCDKLKERLKESDASSENDKMKSELVGCKQKLSEIEERYQLLLGEYERSKRDQAKENSKQLADESMEKLRECEEEKEILRKRLEDLEMNQNDLATASEHEKTKALNDELSKKNDSLKLDLENALTQLKHKTGSIDTLNETLNIMKERLEDRDKELVELRETNEELLGEFLLLKQKCAEGDTGEDKVKELSELEDMLTKCGEDKRNLEIEFERSAKEFAEMKESYEKLLEAYEMLQAKQKCSEEENLPQVEEMLEKCTDEKRDLELRLNELENEIAEQKNNYEKLLKECQTQLKYAEEHLDKRDKELSELKTKLKNCGDDRQELEINKQKLENDLAGMRNTYGNVLEEFKTLQIEHNREKQDNEALQRQNVLLSEQMLQDCENEKKNLKKQLEKLEMQLNLSKQETINCREEAVAKQKGFCDELEKENRNLKAELENALSQLNYSHSTIDSLNEKLSLMEIGLKDREKQISESEERHKKLLEEYQQLLSREEENLAANLSAKIPLTSLADNVPIENLADKNILNKDQSEDSKEKIKAEQMEREAEMNQEKINTTNGESEVFFTKSKSIEADKEIADILLHHQTCTVCKMEAERILGAVDEDSKKNVETERSENEEKREEQNGSKVRAGNKEERNTLESNKEGQTINTKKGGEQQQGVTANTVSEDKPKIDYTKASSEGRFVTWRPSREQKEQPTMDSPLEDSDIASAEQMPLSKVDTSENKQTTNAGMNLDASVISSVMKVATDIENIDTEKEIADILLHHQTCTVCKKEAKRILGTVDKEDKTCCETEGEEGNNKSLDETEFNTVSGEAKETSPVSQNEEKVNPATTKEELTFKSQTEGKGGADSNAAEIVSGKQSSPEVETTLRAKTEVDNDKSAYGHQREESLTGDGESLDTEQIPQSKGDRGVANQKSDTGMNLETSITSSDVRAASIVENIDAEKEIADILLHHQTCTVCKNEAARILSTVDEIEDTLNSIKATSLSPQSEERKDPYTTPIGNETEADRTLVKEKVSGDNTLPGRITSEKLGSSEVEAAMESQNKKDTNKFTSEYQQERLTKDSDAKGASQIKDDTNVAEQSTGTFNTSMDKKEVSFTDDKNAEKEIADTLLHHQKCTICKKEAGRILGTVDEEGENDAITVKSTQENDISKQNGSLEKLADNISDEAKKISRIGENKDDQDSKDEELSKDKKYIDKEEKEKVSEEDGENQIKETFDSEKALSDNNGEENTSRADGGQTSESRDDAREEILEKNYSDIHLETYVTIIEDNNDSLLETEKENPERELVEMKIHHQACTECKEEVERSLHLVDEGDKKSIQTQGNENRQNENSKEIDSKEITPQSKGDITKEKKVISFSTTPLGDEMLTDKVNEIELFNEDGSLTKFMDHIVKTAQTWAEDEERRQSLESSDELPAKDDKGGDDQDIENASKQVRLESGLELTTDDAMNDCSSEQTEYDTWVFREEMKQVPYIKEKCSAENKSKQNNMLKTTESWANLATAVNRQPQSFDNEVQSLEFRIGVDLDVSDNVSPEKRTELGFDDEINEKSNSYVKIPSERIAEEDETDMKSKKTMDKEDKKKEPNSMNFSYLSINYGRQSAPEVETTENQKESHRFRNKTSDDEDAHVYQELININKTEVLPTLKEIDILYPHKKCFICMEKLKHVLDEVKFNTHGTEKIESMIEEAETLLHRRNCDACIEEAGRILELLGELVHETGTSRYEKYDVTDNEVNKMIANNIPQNIAYQLATDHLILKDKIDFEHGPQMLARIQESETSITLSEVANAPDEILRAKGGKHFSRAIMKKIESEVSLVKEKTLKQTVCNVGMSVAETRNYSYTESAVSEKEKYILKVVDILDEVEFDKQSFIKDKWEEELTELKISDSGIDTKSLDTQDSLEESISLNLESESFSERKTYWVKSTEKPHSEFRAWNDIEKLTIECEECHECVEEAKHILCFLEKDMDQEKEVKELLLQHLYCKSSSIIEDTVAFYQHKSSEHCLEKSANTMSSSLVYEQVDQESIKIIQLVKKSMDKLSSSMEDTHILLENRGCSVYNEEPEYTLNSSMEDAHILLENRGCSVYNEEPEYTLSSSMEDAHILLENRGCSVYIEEPEGKEKSEKKEMREQSVQIPSGELCAESKIIDMLPPLNGSKICSTEPENILGSFAKENKQGTERQGLMTEEQKKRLHSLRIDGEKFTDNELPVIKKEEETDNLPFINNPVSGKIMEEELQVIEVKEGEIGARKVSDEPSLAHIMDERISLPWTALKDEERLVDVLKSTDKADKRYDLPSITQNILQLDEHELAKNLASNETIDVGKDQSHSLLLEIQGNTHKTTDGSISVEIEEKRDLQYISEMAKKISLLSTASNTEGLDTEKIINGTIREESIVIANNISNRKENKGRHVHDIENEKSREEMIDDEIAQATNKGKREENNTLQSIHALSSEEMNHEEADHSLNKVNKDEQYRQKSVDKLGSEEMLHQVTDTLTTKEKEEITDLSSTSQKDKESHTLISIDNLATEETLHQGTNLSTTGEDEKEEHKKKFADKLPSEEIHETTDLLSITREEKESYKQASVNELRLEEMLHEAAVMFPAKEKGEESLKNMSVTKFSSEEVIHEGSDSLPTKEDEEEIHIKIYINNMLEMIHARNDLSSTTDKEEENDLIKCVDESSSKKIIQKEDNMLPNKGHEVKRCLQKSIDGIASKEMPHKGNDHLFTKEEGYKKTSSDKLGFDEMLHGVIDLLSAREREEESFMQKSIDNVEFEVFIDEGTDSLPTTEDEEEKDEEKAVDKLKPCEKLLEVSDLPTDEGNEKERYTVMSTDELSFEEMVPEETDVASIKDERCKQKSVDKLSSKELILEVADLLPTKEKEEESYIQKSINKLALVDAILAVKDSIPNKANEEDRQKEVFCENLESEERHRVADLLPNKESEEKRDIQTSIDKMISEDILYEESNHLSTKEGKDDRDTQICLEEMGFEEKLLEVTDLLPIKEMEEEKYILKEIDKMSSEEMIHEENISLSTKEDKELTDFDKFGSEERLYEGFVQLLTKEGEEDGHEKKSDDKLTLEEILCERMDMSSIEVKEGDKQNSMEELTCEDVTQEGTILLFTEEDKGESYMKNSVEKSTSKVLKCEEAYLASFTEKESLKQNSIDSLALDKMLHEGSDLSISKEDDEEWFKQKSIDKLASEEALHKGNDMPFIKEEKEERYTQIFTRKLATKEDQGYDQNQELKGKDGISSIEIEIEDKIFEENVEHGVHTRKLVDDNVEKEIETSKSTKEVSGAQRAQSDLSENGSVIKETRFVKQNETYQLSFKDELADVDRKSEEELLTQKSLGISGEHKSVGEIGLETNAESEMSIGEGLENGGVQIVKGFKDDKIRSGLDQKSDDGIQSESFTTSLSEKEISIRPSSKVNFEAEIAGTSSLHQTCDLCVKDTEFTLREISKEVMPYIRSKENISEEFESKEVNIMEKLAESGTEMKTAEVNDEKKVWRLDEEIRHSSEWGEELDEILSTLDGSGTESKMYDEEYEKNLHKTNITLEIKSEAEMSLKEDHILNQARTPSVTSDEQYTSQIGKDVEVPQEHQSEHLLANGSSLDDSKDRDQELIQINERTLSLESEKQGISEAKEAIAEIQDDTQKLAIEIPSEGNKNVDREIIKPALSEETESDGSVILPYEKSDVEEYKHNSGATDKKLHEQLDHHHEAQKDGTLLHHEDCNVYKDEAEIVTEVMHSKEADMKKNLKEQSDEDVTQQSNIDICQRAKLEFSNVDKKNEKRLEICNFEIKSEALSSKDLLVKEIKTKGMPEKEEAAIGTENDIRMEEASITLGTVGEEEKLMDDKQKGFQSAILNEDAKIKHEETPIKQQLIESIIIKEETSMESGTTPNITEGLKSVVSLGEKDRMQEIIQATNQEKSHPQNSIERSVSYELLTVQGKEVDNINYSPEYYESAFELESLKSQQQELNESLKHLEEEKKHFFTKCSSLKHEIAAFKCEEVESELLSMEEFAKDLKYHAEDLKAHEEEKKDPAIIAEFYKQWLHNGRNEEVRLQQQIRILQQLSAKLTKELSENRKFMIQQNENVRKKQRVYLESDKKHTLTVLVNVAKLEKQNERRNQDGERKPCNCKDNSMLRKTSSNQPQSENDPLSMQKSTTDKRHDTRHK